RIPRLAANAGRSSADPIVTPSDVDPGKTSSACMREATATDSSVALPDVWAAAAAGPSTARTKQATVNRRTRAANGGSPSTRLPPRGPEARCRLVRAVASNDVSAVQHLTYGGGCRPNGFQSPGIGAAIDVRGESDTTAGGRRWLPYPVGPCRMIRNVSSS